jgi:hypothetical protein
MKYSETEVFKKLNEDEKRLFNSYYNVFVGLEQSIQTAINIKDHQQRLNEYRNVIDQFYDPVVNELFISVATVIAIVRNEKEI